MSYACFYYPLIEAGSFDATKLFSERLESLDKEIQTRYSGKVKLQVLDTHAGYMLHVNTEDLGSVLDTLFATLGFPQWAGDQSDYTSIEKVLHSKGKKLTRPLLGCSPFQWIENV